MLLFFAFGIKPLQQTLAIAGPPRLPPRSAGLCSPLIPRTPGSRSGALGLIRSPGVEEEGLPWFPFQQVSPLPVTAFWGREKQTSGDLRVKSVSIVSP